MSDPIAEYQQWKKQGGDLRSRAKQAIEARFRQLLGEAVQLAEEYRSDFGTVLPLPSPVTTFRYKAAGKKATKKAAAPKAPPAAPAPAPISVPRPAPAAKPDPKIAALAKQLDGARKKLETAKAKGGSTKNLEDRVYELEDDLRLAMETN